MSLMTTAIIFNTVFGETVMLPDGIHYIEINNETDLSKESSGVPTMPETESIQVSATPAEPVMEFERGSLAEAAEEFDIQIVKENLEDIPIPDLSTIDLSPSKEVIVTPVYSDDLSYTYHNGMSAVAKQANTDALAIVNHYMEKCDYIPLKDPKWVIALGSIEFQYVPNDKDLIFAWPVDLADYNDKFMLAYNWQYVNNKWGSDVTTARTGGAIGPFQCESFFGEGVPPVIESEFGTIGSPDATRTDCWTVLGTNPQGIGNIAWEYGTRADRWSIADSTNIILGVYNLTMKRTNYTAEIYSMSKYEQATLLMWGHNAGTGIINQRNRIDTSKKIATYRDEIYKVISEVKPARFSRSNDLMATVNKICSEVGCPQYPVMSLMSYMITEARYNGEW